MNFLLKFLSNSFFSLQVFFQLWNVTFSADFTYIGIYFWLLIFIFYLLFLINSWSNSCRQISFILRSLIIVYWFNLRFIVFILSYCLIIFIRILYQFYSYSILIVIKSSWFIQINVILILSCFHISLLNLIISSLIHLFNGYF